MADHVNSPTVWVKQPTAPHRRSFILLHGRGDTGPNFGAMFLNIAQTSSGATLPEVFPDMRFICPTSPERAVGHTKIRIHQWFDVKSLKNPSLDEEIQIVGLQESVSLVRALIEEELSTLKDSNSIFIGGLSQGCATSLHVLLTYELKLGGMIGLSGWMPFGEHIETILKESCRIVESNEGSQEVCLRIAEYFQNMLGLQKLCETPSGAVKTPVWLGHGNEDETVDIKFGLQISHLLKEIGFAVDWNVYDFGHWYKVPDEIDNIATFLQRHIV